MKKNFRIILTTMLALMGTGVMQAQTDVTTQYLVNPGFESHKNWLDNGPSGTLGSMAEYQGQVDFSLMHYDEETFSVDKLHPWELTAQSATYVRFDAYQRGIGDATFNLGVLDKYRCPSTPQTFTLRFELEVK